MDQIVKWLVPDESHLLINQFANGRTSCPNIFVRLKETNVNFRGKKASQCHSPTQWNCHTKWS